MTRAPRPYWRSFRSYWYWVAIAALIVAQRLVISPQPAEVAAPETLDSGIHEVRRVVDGDTLLLTSGARVRLQGIDTPETVKPDWPVEPWGPEASQFTKAFIESAGNRVRLTFEQERRDDYGRFLAFVWDGDRLLNEELVQAGLAHARHDYRYSNTMKRRLDRAQTEAKRAGRGLWSDATSTE